MINLIKQLLATKTPTQVYETIITQYHDLWMQNIYSDLCFYGMWCIFLLIPLGLLIGLIHHGIKNYDECAVAFGGVFGTIVTLFLTFNTYCFITTCTSPNEKLS